MYFIIISETFFFANTDIVDYCDPVSGSDV